MMINPLENSCTGCGACRDVCPVNCISMRFNRNGFLMPVIEQDKCLKCGLCKKTCPVSNDIERSSPKHVYAAYSNNSDAILSASGGIFYAIASAWLKLGGLAFGAAFDDEMNLRISEAFNQNDLIRLQGVKYLQADTSNSFSKAKMYLSDGKKVLYSGTPCQIAGLRSTLRDKDLGNLITVEIICHGVPSPKMFKDYLAWLEKRKNKGITNYCFRTKKKGNQDFHNLVFYSDGSDEIISGFRDAFYRVFMSANSYRDICYECPFASQQRVADITIGDFWNIEQVNVDFGKNKRVSYVSLNSQKAIDFWPSVLDEIESLETDWKIAIKGNINLEHPSPKPASYFAYGDVGDPNAFFEAKLEEKGNYKKELFNKLPMSVRRRIKKAIH